MLVQDFCNNRVNLFPDEFYESLPQHCFEEGCGYPMEMTETLTHLHCSNPRCPSKIVRRLTSMANDLGVKNLGEARAAKLIHNFGITNPLLIFVYEPLVDGAIGDGVGMEVSLAIVNQFTAKKKMTLPEYVKIAHLPFIQTSAVSIFSDYDSLAFAYRDIETGGVDFIRSKLNIDKGTKKESDDEFNTEDISVRAMNVYQSLMTFKEDLFQGLRGVEIINTRSLINLTAVCSDEVGMPFRTKADFYATVNNLSDKVHVQFLGAVNKSIDYLVWAGADGTPARYTNKVKKVEAWNDKFKQHEAEGTLEEGEHYIPIVSAGMFINMIEDL